MVYELPPQGNKRSRSPQSTPRSQGRTPRSRSRTPREKATPRSEEGGYHPRSEIPKVPYDDFTLELAYFEKLPSSSIKRNVFSAYDGDGLTLRGDDNAKVRFLAIDTPEVQLNEPYAEEARLFNAGRCLGKDVHLTFEADRQDRYGRLLALVFVKDHTHPPNKYFCVNVGLLEAGLATYYHPQHTELSLDSLLLQAQKKAREAKINIWRDVDEDAVVYLTGNGKAFHTKTCTSIEHSALTSTTMREALDDGRNPCRDCHPQWATANSSSSSRVAKKREESKEVEVEAAVTVVAAAEDTSDEVAATNEERDHFHTATPADEDK